MNTKSSRCLSALVFVLALNLAPQLEAQLTLINVGHSNNGGTAQDIALAGSYAYVAAGTAGLLIYDISNPAMPVKVGQTNGPSDLGDYHLAVSGNYAYVMTLGSEGGFNVYDISNPAHPTNLYGTIANLFGGIAVDGTNLYLGSDSVLSICNISTPASPVLVTNLHIASNPGYLSISSNYIAMSAGTILDTDSLSNGLYTANLEHTNIGYDLQVLAITGQYIFATLNATSPLHSYLISSNGAVAAGQVNYPTTNSAGIGYCVAISGNYAFLGCTSGLRVINISNPTNLLPMTATPNAYGGTPYGVAVSGPYIYVANGSDGLRVFEMSPTLSVAESSSNTLSLTWPTIASFALQQRSLTDTNWVTLTNVPVIVGLSNQVNLTYSGSGELYRLISVE